MVRRYPTRRRQWLSSITKQSLFDAWEHVKDGSSAGRDGETPELFAAHLDKSIVRLNHNLRHNRHRFIAYNQLLKSKGADKAPRVISVPAVTDRVVLRAMASFLREVAPSASMRLPQDLVAEAISELESGRWTHFLKLDIKNFYPSISHTFLKAALNRTVRSSDAIDMFFRAITTPTISRGGPKTTDRETQGVPQGLPISNGLAELTLAHLDSFLHENDSCFATRFVDDILVLTHPNHAPALESEIRRRAKLANLEVHDSSSGSSKSASGQIAKGFDFLGYQFEWPRVTVRPGSVHKIEARLARAFTAYRYALRRNPTSDPWREQCQRRLEWHLNLVITGFTLEERRIGWLAYFSQMRHHQLLHHLDGLVQKKSKRFGVESMQFKSFVSTYRIVSSKRADNTGYVPNFDTISEEEMRRILVDIFAMRDVPALTGDEVKARFLRKIRKISRELEADVPSYG